MILSDRLPAKSVDNHSSAALRAENRTNYLQEGLSLRWFCVSWRTVWWRTLIKLRQQAINQQDGYEMS
jgi:hypothetical protein